MDFILPSQGRLFLRPYLLFLSTLTSNGFFRASLLYILQHLLASRIPQHLTLFIPRYNSLLIKVSEHISPQLLAAQQLTINVNPSRAGARTNGDHSVIISHARCQPAKYGIRKNDQDRPALEGEATNMVKKFDGDHGKTGLAFSGPPLPKDNGRAHSKQIPRYNSRERHFIQYYLGGVILCPEVNGVPGMCKALRGKSLSAILTVITSGAPTPHGPGSVLLHKDQNFTRPPPQVEKPRLKLSDFFQKNLDTKNC